MRQIYYTIRTLLRERGSNIIRIISLSLGLTIGILLFSQIAFELSYEQCYPEAERLALVRCQRINLSTGETLVMIKRPVMTILFSMCWHLLWQKRCRKKWRLPVVSFRYGVPIFIMKINCCPMQITSLRILVSFRLSAYRCWKAIPKI